MRTLTITTLRGTEVRIEANYTEEIVAREINADGHRYTSGTEKKETFEVNVYINGALHTTLQKQAYFLNRGTDLHELCGVCSSITLNIDDATRAEVEDFIAAVRESGTEETSTEELEEVAKEIAELEEIVAIGDKEADCKMLKNEKEYAEWAKRYNDLYNEGCSDGLPARVTLEQYNNALDRLDAIANG